MTKNNNIRHKKKKFNPKKNQNIEIVKVTIEEKHDKVFFNEINERIYNETQQYIAYLEAYIAKKIFESPSEIYIDSSKILEKYKDFIKDDDESNKSMIEGFDKIWGKYLKKGSED